MKKVPSIFSLGLCIFLFTAIPATNFAQTGSETTTPATNISNDYSYFLEKVNSQQVVNDLRNGQWTTTATDSNTNLTTTTSESLPTGKMGYGNVKISLALAQESLNQQGIMQPTSEQLHTALMGGELVQGDSTTMTNGILQMRADGMGWGQIAQKYDVKLGTLMSGKQPAATATTTTTTTTASTSTTNKGIATANGKSSTTGPGRGNGKAFSGSASGGSGIVSGSGRSFGTSHGSTSQTGRGIVSGSGRSFGTSHGSTSQAGSGIVSGSGRSMGHMNGIVTGAGGGHQYGASGGGRGNAGGHGKGSK